MIRMKLVRVIKIHSDTPNKIIITFKDDRKLIYHFKITILNTGK